MKMQTEQLNIKLHPELCREIELVSKVLHIQKNEWARNILAHEVKKELEAHKQFLVREFLKGSVSRKELVDVLGIQEVVHIEHIASIGKKSFDNAKQVAKEMK